MGHPAAYLMFWLLRRRVEHQEVCKLLSATFTPEEVKAALEAKWMEKLYGPKGL